MSRATLADVLLPALREGYAVPGFVCLGWEDARAYALAAQDENAPVILQAGPAARAHMPVAVWGAMFGELANHVDVPVVLHLDHGRSENDIREALAAGFTAVMFDGSDLPLDENIRLTALMTALAHEADASCEGEIGKVGYAGDSASDLTDPAEAALFARETGVDALAIAVGNTHLVRKAEQPVDEAALEAIATAMGGDVPLVIHGGSGVPHDQRARLARATPVCKFNIGTELRQVFGTALRATLATEPDAFDRLAILRATEPALRDAARTILRGLGASGKARSPTSRP